jgi:ferritin-like metal-binding protein YciE
MFEKLNTPEELFDFKLGAALKMENEILKMLPELQEHAQRAELEQALKQHEEETRDHVANVEGAFRALGKEPDDSPCPAIEGLRVEGKANLKKTDDSVIDAVILSAAAETEHHEIAVYESLIVHARARGAEEAAQLLERNLESERRTLEHVRESTEKVAREGVAVGA